MRHGPPTPGGTFVEVRYNAPARTPLDAHPCGGGKKGGAKGKNPVKGAHELEDRSHHYVDGVTGQPISSRRRREAAAREAFYGLTYDIDGHEIIDDDWNAD